jgi:hypothetical protein
MSLRVCGEDSTEPEEDLSNDELMGGRSRSGSQEDSDISRDDGSDNPPGNNDQNDIIQPFEPLPVVYEPGPCPIALHEQYILTKNEEVSIDQYLKHLKTNATVENYIETSNMLARWAGRRVLSL